MRITEVDDVGAAASIAERAAATFPLACPPGSRDEDIEAFIAENLTAESFAADIKDSERVVLCVEHGSAPIGYSLLIRGTDPAGPAARGLKYRPTIELSKFYVLPAHHGRAISWELMNAVFQAGRRTGARGIWLGVNRENARAMSFYTRSGFSTIGERTFQVGHRTEYDLVLERAL